MYVYQIEVSNVCSLSCWYCPHPTQRREKGYMTMDTFKKCVELYKSSQNENFLFLHNFGEVLLHPNIIEFIRYAKSNNVECSFFTNGTNVDGKPFSKDLYNDLYQAGLRNIDFSEHKLKVDEFRSYLHKGITINNVFTPNSETLGNWAGQVNIAQEKVSGPCIFEKKNALVILWDGKVSSCCIDVEGRENNLTIDNLLKTKKYTFSGISICKNCSSMRDDEVL